MPVIMSQLTQLAQLTPHGYGDAMGALGATVVRSSGRQTGRTEERSVANDWISVRQAAALLGVSVRTVQRSLADEERRAVEWGAEGEGWRHKPLSTRGIYQLRRALVERKARGGW